MVQVAASFLDCIVQGSYRAKERGQHARFYREESMQTYLAATLILDTNLAIYLQLQEVSNLCLLSLQTHERGVPNSFRNNFK